MINKIKKSISLWQLNDNYLSFLDKLKEIEIIVDYLKFDLSNQFLKNPRINLDYENIFSVRLNEILESDFYY